MAHATWDIKERRVVSEVLEVFAREQEEFGRTELMACASNDVRACKTTIGEIKKIEDRLQLLYQKFANFKQGFALQHQELSLTKSKVFKLHKNIKIISDRLAASDLAYENLHIFFKGCILDANTAKQSVLKLEKDIEISKQNLTLSEERCEIMKNKIKENISEEEGITIGMMEITSKRQTKLEELQLLIEEMSSKMQQYETILNQQKETILSNRNSMKEYEEKSKALTEIYSTETCELNSEEMYANVRKRASLHEELKTKISQSRCMKEELQQKIKFQDTAAKILRNKKKEIQTSTRKVISNTRTSILRQSRTFTVSGTISNTEQQISEWEMNSDPSYNLDFSFDVMTPPKELTKRMGEKAKAARYQGKFRL